MPRKRKFVYYIPESGYDTLNDHEGRWKYDPDAEEKFEQYYPEDDFAKIKKNEFHIGANFESGGWSIEGNIELFEQWVEENGRDIDCIMDDPPEPEDMESCYD